DLPQASRARAREQAGERRIGRGALAIPVEAGAAVLHRLHRLAEGLAKGTADRHDLADRLHLDREGVVAALELLEGEAWDLGDDVVDGRLEAGRSDARDVVLEFVEGVANGELRGELGDRKARRLRRERRRTTYTRVHLDHDDATVLRIDGKLNVAAARGHADLRDDRLRRVAEALVLLVGERQGGRNGDAVAGVHTHRVEVLDRAHDHEVVLRVAHDLELVLFPPENGLLDQGLASHRLRDRVLDHRVELFAVVRDGGTRAAEGEARADDRGKADVVERGASFGERVDVKRSGDAKADVEHRGFEHVPVFGLLDDVLLGAEHLHTVV